MKTLEADGNKHFDHGLVIEILTCDAIDPSSRYFISCPNDGGGGEVFGLDREITGSLMFAHFGGPVFMARMFELADRTCSILLWTSGPEDGPIMGVTRPEFLGLVPDEAQLEGEPIAVIRTWTISPISWAVTCSSR